MPCVSPFSVRNGFPCGWCIGCRIDKTRHWAIRIMHETFMHDVSSFVTLTYSDKTVPLNFSLVKDEVPALNKKLRSRGLNFRFYMCGEYGDMFDRPHYHVCYFGVDFLKERSVLDDCWNRGIVHVGHVTPQSAAYVAGYVMKKVVGDRAKEHYGEKIPEFSLMSRRPGIGYDWYKKYLSENDRDWILFKNCKNPLPRYYRNKREESLSRLDRVLARASRDSEIRERQLDDWKKFLSDLPQGKRLDDYSDEVSRQFRFNLESKNSRK
jgi:hypothetical protein